MNLAHSKLYVSSKVTDFNFLKSGQEGAVCFSKNMILAAFLLLLLKGSSIVALAPPQLQWVT